MRALMGSQCRDMRMVKCDFVCDIEKLVLLLSFEPSEDFPAYTLGYHRKENYNNLIYEAQRH